MQVGRGPPYDYRGRCLHDHTPAGHLQETEAFGALEVVNMMDDETVDAMVMRASRISA